MPNLEWYRIFLETAKTKNLTKAAKALYITQPSVNYAIKQLEAESGLKLFQRLSKGVELTPEGEVLLEYVQRSFALLDQGEKKIEQMKRLEGGELRVGASDSLFKHLLLPYLNQFRAAYPDILLRLSHGKSTDLIQRLKEGLIDLGIVHMPISDPDLIIHPLVYIQDAFIAGEDYRELAHRPLSAHELIQHPLLLLSPQSSTRLFLEKWFERQGISVEANVELGSIDLLVQFARYGFGIAFVTSSFLEEELEGDELIVLETMEKIPSRCIGLAVRRDKQLSLAASQFYEMLRDSISAYTAEPYAN